MLILKQDGNVVTGSAGSNEDKQSKIKNGKAGGHEIQINIETHGGMSMTFHLHLEGEHLKGEVNGEMPGNKIRAN